MLNILFIILELFMLMLSYVDVDKFFGKFKCVIIDEMYSLMVNKCGDFFLFVFVWLSVLLLYCKCIGLLVIVVFFEMLGVWLVGSDGVVNIVKVKVGEKFKVEMLYFKVCMFFGGFMVCYVIDDIY